MPRRPEPGPHVAPWAMALACLAACSSGDGERPRSALVITVDGLRADALGAYGRSPSVTPLLDALALDAVRYEEARTVAPLTLPAHASLWTGLYPPRHTLRADESGPLPAAARTLAELASDGGLATAAFVSLSTLDSASGLAQGFERYDAPAHVERGMPGLRTGRSALDTTRAALRWLRQQPADEPYLVWIELSDPLAPHAAPLSFADQSGGDPYLGEVAFVDQAVGQLLAELRADGRLADTLILFSGAHGAALGEHGEATHGAFCYEPTLRVPLLVLHPDGRGAGQSVRERVSLADVAPTLADALALGSLEADGVSLFTGAPPAERGVYFESCAGFLERGWSPLAGWIDSRGKYIACMQPELYDPHSDPSEARNQLPAREALRAEFTRALADVAARAVLPRDAAPELDDELIRELAALGLTPPAAPDLPEPHQLTDLPSPMERAHELRAQDHAATLLEQGEWAEAEPLLDSIVRANPRNVLAWEQLCAARAKLAQWNAARDALEARLRLQGAGARTYEQLGLCYEALGSSGAARTLLRTALVLDPQRAGAREALGVR